MGSELKFRTTMGYAEVSDAAVRAAIPSLQFQVTPSPIRLLYLRNQT